MLNVNHNSNNNIYFKHIVYIYSLHRVDPQKKENHQVIMPCTIIEEEKKIEECGRK